MPRIRVFLSAEEANEAARADEEEDEFYDVRGIVLTCVEHEGGSSRLRAHGEGDPAALRQRLLTELRSAAELAPAEEAAEVEAILCWLEAAPSLEYMLHGLAFGPVENGGDESLVGIHCHRCNVFEKLWRHDCCPGG